MQIGLQNRRGKKMAERNKLQHQQGTNTANDN